MRRRVLTTTAAAALAGFGAGILPRRARAVSSAGPRTVVLGQSAPFSGPVAQLGLQFHLGARLHFDQVNAQGGVHGRQIDLRRLDDANQLDRCLANTRQWLDAEVFGLFGYLGADTAAAALALASARRMPFFAPATGSASVREPFNRLAVHVRASYLDEIGAIVRQMALTGIRRVAIFHEDDDFGRSSLGFAREALAAAKLEPVAVAARSSADPQLPAAVAALVAPRPEAMLLLASYRPVATFVRLARRAAYQGGLYAVSHVGTQALLDELGAEARGVVVSQVVPYPYAPVTALSAAYAEALAATRGVWPSYSGIEGFVAARAFTELLRRAGPAATREAFLQAVDAMDQFDLGGFRLSFGPQRRQGSRFVEMTMLGGDGRIRR